VLAWPGAEVAVMGPLAAVRILHRRRLADVPPDSLAKVEAELAVEHAKIAGGVDRALEIGVIDEVVEPVVTRSAVARAIVDEVQANGVQHGAHGNIPL
jgi:acetyl-CoA/propionyl-CoA carboxylase carboxyl transferase subunit